MSSSNRVQRFGILLAIVMRIFSIEVDSKIIVTQLLTVLQIIMIQLESPTPTVARGANECDRIAVTDQNRNKPIIQASLTNIILYLTNSKWYCLF